MLAYDRAHAETEWGVLYEAPCGAHITWVPDEQTARRDAAAKPAPGQRITLVRRRVFFRSWQPVHDQKRWNNECLTRSPVTKTTSPGGSS
jgi:hypothetical protein